VYEDSYVIVIRDAVRFRDGRHGPYVRFLRASPGTSAGVLPLLPDGRVMLIRHFRHASRRWQWEIPRGFPDGAADSATTARQELWEELGVRVGSVELLGRMDNDGSPDDIYLARLTELGSEWRLPDSAAEEGIDEARPVTLAELDEMISSGQVTDAHLLSAYALARAAGLLA
jgi:ADP-ribose pyrophosphatase